ncbi:hypothetical protein [Kocuria rosea]|uniref:hypothetical protein n=1 Tax=Kocuria rosea TaxID=1275 RepID=UPI0023312960|nr:hypothetical protein [Kocuria rosea]
MQSDLEPVRIRVHALSAADALGYRGQLAVAQAVGDRSDYRLIGGHMVRLLLQVYPSERAVPRSTVDADTALNDVEIIGAVTRHLQEDGFTKVGGNVLTKTVADEQEVEINLLLPREDYKPGIKPISVPGVGQVDTLPELSFALGSPAVVIDVEAHLFEGEVIEYQTRVPTLEMATILKAHSWSSRRSEKDLADLYTLLEIREAHPTVAWKLNIKPLVGRRLDAARILHPLAERIRPRRAPFAVPDNFNRLRFSALIEKHVGTP